MLLRLPFVEHVAQWCPSYFLGTWILQIRANDTLVQYYKTYMQASLKL